jgi:hypothetical protein
METSVESVEKDGEGGVGLDELFDEGEVKDVFEHCDIIFYRVDDFDGQVSVALCTDGRKVDIDLR